MSTSSSGVDNSFRDSLVVETVNLANHQLGTSKAIIVTYSLPADLIFESVGSNKVVLLISNLEPMVEICYFDAIICGRRLLAMRVFGVLLKICYLLVGGHSSDGIR